MSKDTGGPAFPETWTNESDTNSSAPNGVVVPASCSTQLPGMTLRDYFAAKAMQGWIANSPRIGGELLAGDAAHAESLSAVAYRFADAMLAERAK